MLAVPQRLLKFADFTLDTVRCVLLRGALELPLRRQSLEVLRYLAEHAGKVVSSDELVEALWSVKPADHNASVGQCIKEIRRAIGDDARWIIKTVSGRGYEFMAEVVQVQPEAVASAPVPQAAVAGVAGEPSALTIETPVDASDPAPALASARPWQPSWLLPISRWRRPHWLLAAALSTVLIVGLWVIGPGRPAPRNVPTMMAAPTLAVLPFTILGSEEALRSLAADIEAQLRSELARADRGFDLIVKSTADDRGWSPSPKIAASQLGARYVVAGSASLDRDVQRANIRLIEIETDTEAWSESFEAGQGEPRALEQLAARIARLIAFHVAAAESRRPLPERPEAGHFVILGRAIVDSERGSTRTREALTYFEKALELDSNAIFALRGLAGGKIAQVRNGWIPLKDQPAALNQAEAAIERMIKLDHRNIGAHWLRGFLLRERGDVDHAIAALEHALSLNPNYVLALAELGRTKIDAGRASEGLKDIEETIRRNPTDPSINIRYFWAGMAAVHLGDDRAAVTWLLKARQANRSYAPTKPWLAVAYLGAGDGERARAMIAEYLAVSPGFSIAAWNRIMASRNPIVIEQRKRIENAFRRLGIPEGKSPEAQH